MIINHNITALNTHRQLSTNTANQSKSIEKLSSGLRINRAGDDAAGLAISEKMRGQIRGLDQASRNAQDGISLIQTAEGALNETHDILQRMRELAVQASNGTNTETDRDSIQSEMNQLTSEVNRIANTTEFNTQKTLKGTNATAVTSTAAGTTVAAGQTGVAAGTISALTTNANSVKGVSSNATVQANTSEVTGAVSVISETSASVKATKSSVTVANGITFSADASGTSLNGKAIEIKQGSGTSVSSSLDIDATTGKYTFTIGTDSSGATKAGNRGQLYNELKSAIDNATFAAGQEISVNVPNNTAVAVSSVATSGTLTGGTNEIQGSYNFDITKAFHDSGDTITIGGQTFTAVNGGAVAANGQFDVSLQQPALTGTNAVNEMGKVDANAAAVINTGALTLLGNGDAGTLSFNGVTVNISASGAGGNTTANTTANSIDLHIDTTVATTATLQAAQIATALNAIKAAGGSSSALADFTIANAAANLTFTAGTNTDKYNTAAYDVATTGNVAVASAGAAQHTTAGGQAIAANTSVSFNVDGTDFTLDNADLTGLFDGSTTGAAIAAAINGATDSGGALLSTKATASFDATSGKLTITDNSTGQTSNVKFSVNAGAAADTAVLERAFGITNNSNATQQTEQSKSLLNAINANSALSTRFTGTINSSGNITLTEKAGQQTGVALANPIAAGSGTNDKLLISDGSGQNLKTVSLGKAVTATEVAATTSFTDGTNSITISGTGAGSAGNAVQIKIEANTAATAAASFSDGVLTLKLGTTNTNNDGAGIQAAIQALGNQGGINFAQWTAAGATGFLAGAVTDSTVNLSGGKNATTADVMSVDSVDGQLQINLAGDLASKNTAAKIQAAVQALGNVSYFDASGNKQTIDYSKYTFQAQGSWDTKALGTTNTSSDGTFVGGTTEVKGDYSLDISTAFAAGDTAIIKGQVFKAVAANADSSKGEFNVAGGNLSSQASGLIDAINLNASLSGSFTAAATGSTITLTELKASGTDLKTQDMKVAATGVQGQYKVDTSQLLTDGASISIDGQSISVSDKTSHVGYGDGTAIKEAGSAAQQTQNLADAINKNTSLNQLYTASVAADGSLQLDQKIGNTTAPEVKMTTSTKGDFATSFQVGANSGQSMNVAIKDMRAEALGISGDGTSGTVAAKDGKVASYVSVANISDGTSTTNTEFSLDVSSADKATAAISVINDAIEAVSAQRSQLGAYQNRLEHTINNLKTSSENVTSAESRIRDVDMAKEIMSQSKASILAQAAQAMLAQANQQPQGVLQLLR